MQEPPLECGEILMNITSLQKKIDVTREHELFNFDAKLKFGTSYSFKYRDL